MKNCKNVRGRGSENLYAIASLMASRARRSLSHMKVAGGHFRETVRPTGQLRMEGLSEFKKNSITLSRIDQQPSGL
jgi:hypothetical protein